MGHGLLTAVVWLMFFYCCKDLGRGQKCFKICKYCQKGTRKYFKHPPLPWALCMTLMRQGRLSPRA